MLSVLMHEYVVTTCMYAGMLVGAFHMHAYARTHEGMFPKRRDNI